MEKAEMEIRVYLKMVSELRRPHSEKAGFKYAGTEDMVLKEGRYFAPAPLAKGIRKGQKKLCYMNASKLMLDNDFTYCEGYGTNGSLGIPFAHAWCIDKDGNVVDNTWDEPTGYFGIKFSKTFVAKRMCDTGVYGVFGEINEFCKKGLPPDAVDRGNGELLKEPSPSAQQGNCGRPMGKDLKEELK